MVKTFIFLLFFCSNIHPVFALTPTNDISEAKNFSPTHSISLTEDEQNRLFTFQSFETNLTSSDQYKINIEQGTAQNIYESITTSNGMLTLNQIFSLGSESFTADPEGIISISDGTVDVSINAYEIIAPFTIEIRNDTELLETYSGTFKHPLIINNELNYFSVVCDGTRFPNILLSADLFKENLDKSVQNTNIGIFYDFELSRTYICKRYEILSEL